MAVVVHRVVVVVYKIPTYKIIFVAIAIVIHIIYVTWVKLPRAANIFQYMPIAVGIFA